MAGGCAVVHGYECCCHVCLARKGYFTFAALLVRLSNEIEHINTPTWEQEYGVRFPGEPDFDFSARLLSIQRKMEDLEHLGRYGVT